MTHFNLIVIGAGSGGVRAARMAASTGASVAVVEAKALGGTCVNVGCVPKKLFSYAAHYAEDFHDAKGFGWDVSVEGHSWQDLIDNKNNEISRLNGIYKNILENAGVKIIQGFACLTGENTITVNDETLTADKILLAVGGTPNAPSFKGAEHCFNSDEAFYLPELKQSMVIVGGGYIAVEFAGIFNALGLDVHIVYRGEHVLKEFDRPSTEFLVKQMLDKGVKLHLHAEITQVDDVDGIKHCLLNNGETLAVDHVFWAAGRKPLVEQLGLDKAAVKLNSHGFIEVDEHFETSTKGIFALGDVIGTPALTPVALAQAMAFVDQQFKGGNKQVDYNNIPTAIFSQPNVASVGLSEQQVVEQGIKVDVYQSDFKHLKHTLSGNQERTLMRIIVERESQKILGMHMVGSEAGELIQGFAVAVVAGLTKEALDATIGIHPTAAEEFVTMREFSYQLG